MHYRLTDPCLKATSGCITRRYWNAITYAASLCSVPLRRSFVKVASEKSYISGVESATVRPLRENQMRRLPYRSRRGTIVLMAVAIFELSFVAPSACIARPDQLPNSERILWTFSHPGYAFRARSL